MNDLLSSLQELDGLREEIVGYALETIRPRPDLQHVKVIPMHFIPEHLFVEEWYAHLLHEGDGYVTVETDGDVQEVASEWRPVWDNPPQRVHHREISISDATYVVSLEARCRRMAPITEVRDLRVWLRPDADPRRVKEAVARAKSAEWPSSLPS